MSSVFRLFILNARQVVQSTVGSTPQFGYSLSVATTAALFLFALEPARSTPLPPLAESSSREPVDAVKVKTTDQLVAVNNISSTASALTLSIPVPTSATQLNAAPWPVTTTVAGTRSPIVVIAQALPLPTTSQPPQSGTGYLPPAPINPYATVNQRGYYPQTAPMMQPNYGAPQQVPMYSQAYPQAAYGYGVPQYPAPQYPPQYAPQQYAQQQYAQQQYAPQQYPAPPIGYSLNYQQPYAQPYSQQPYSQQPYQQQQYAQPYQQQPQPAQPYQQQYAQPYQQPPQPYAQQQQPYGMPAYGMQNYAAGYGAQNYAMPVYPMPGVIVLPPVAAPVNIRSAAQSFGTAPIGYPGAPIYPGAPMYANEPLRSPIEKEGFLVGPGKAQQLQAPNRNLFRTTALTKPSLTLQAAYVYQAGDSSARARLQGIYPLSQRVLFGATIDLSTGTSFTDTPTSGLNINELYLATSLPEIPNLRFALGQLDLTSYFDRNSFAKDGTTHFFNPIFQTNPALSEVGIGSRPAALINWSLTDNIEIKGAAFSSARSIGDFALNGFAGEVGFRYGNAIVRGTYATGRADANGGGFREASQINRGGGRFGVLKGDREESFGVNAEVFIPRLKMGIFGRYGRYNNLDMNEGGDTASVGISFLDVFAPDDRLGLAYGQGLSNDARRASAGLTRPDALELFYDFRFLPNLRVGFSIQERNSFSEIVAGFRVKTEFDVMPRGK